MTYEELLQIFVDHGAKPIGERAEGSLIEFQVYTLFIRRPMNGQRYDGDELKHNLASYRQQTEGEVYEDYTHIFTWGNGKKKK